MKETTINYIKSRINHAKRFPGNLEMGRLYENQAFGALELFCHCVYETDPEAEQELINRWNDNWRFEFEKIMFGERG